LRRNSTRTSYLVPRTGAIALAIALSALNAFAQEAMSFEDYDPKSTLVVPEHPRTKAKYPFIDVHNHQRRDRAGAEV
jgi:hypothetical protein